MKRSHNEIYSSTSSSDERNRKVRVTSSQVIITLDQTIGSNLLYHKFRIQTTELQLFLQHVPILYWYPIQEPNFKYNIDECVFKAAVRNLLHQYFMKLLPTMNCVEVLQHDCLFKSLLDDEEFILAMKDEKVLKYASDRLKDNEKIVLELVKQNGQALEFASKRLKDNEEFVLQCSTLNGQALEYASDRLKDNEEFVLECIKLNVEAFKYVLHRLLRGDFNFVLFQAFKQNYSALEFAFDRLKDDEILQMKYLLEAVKEKSIAFDYASKRFKDNETIVLEAVKQNGEALRYSSKRLKDNDEIVLEAVKQDGKALYYASDRLQDNETIVLEAVKQNGKALRYSSNRLQDNEEFVLEAIKKNYYAFGYASKRLKDNDEIVLEAVKQNGKILEFASNRLKDSELIVLEAIKQNGIALYYASDRLKNDFNFANELFKCCNSLDLFEYFGEELKSIEFIYYFIENYQSRFHEIIRTN